MSQTEGSGCLFTFYLYPLATLAIVHPVTSTDHICVELSTMCRDKVGVPNKVASSGLSPSVVLRFIEYFDD